MPTDTPIQPKADEKPAELSLEAEADSDSEQPAAKPEPVASTGAAAASLSMTESLQHDRKVVAILYTLAVYLRQAPETTFVVPYRPTTLPLHQEAADLCQTALAPALEAIDQTVRTCVLNPVCRALNRRIATTVLPRMHAGVYLQQGSAKLQHAVRILSWKVR